MHSKLFNRRKFLWGLGLSTLSSSFLFQNTQVKANNSQTPSVLVLGAGLSGLYTALLLERVGVKVVVLEGRDRVGGRVYTLDNLPGKPEAGGQGFSEKYQRLLAVAESLHLPTEQISTSERKLLLYVRSQSVLSSDWAASTANTSAQTERNTLPPQLLTSYLGPDNPLSDETAWTRAEYADLDIPLDQYLRAKGASREALRLMNFSPGSSLNSIEATSTLWALRNNQRAKTRSKQPMRIEGGNSRLPEKMAAALKFPVQVNKIVTSIGSSSTCVEVQCSDGSRFRANYAVITLPFSVLRRIKITPPLQGRQAQAVVELPYTIVTRIQLGVRRPFWEEDGLPTPMWTDTQLETISPIKDATGRQNLVCITSGTNAQQLDAMSPQVLAECVQSQLARIRPTSKGNVQITKVISWARDPFSQGAYAHFAPGQIRRFQDKMAQPWQRLHFAGEHTAISSSGMEAALESAERVTNEVLGRIK